MNILFGVSVLCSYPFLFKKNPKGIFVFQLVTHCRTHEFLAPEQDRTSEAAGNAYEVHGVAGALRAAPLRLEEQTRNLQGRRIRGNRSQNT